MPKEQQTFHFVPVSLVNTNGPTRPMTSKQAKKAYQQRTRGQKTSLAEERRLEKEERDKQRREWEREQAAAKSKAAREKKAKKAQEEKEERKRMGIPEPSKYVRASQPTISRFVKNGNKRTWQAMESLEEGEESDGTICAKDDRGPAAKRIESGDDSEDEFGEFPSFSQSDLPKFLENIDEVSSCKDKGQGAEPMMGEHEQDEGLPAMHAQQTQQTEDEDALADMATTQLLSEAADAVNRDSDAQSGEVLKERSVNMRSPPVTRSITFAPTPTKPPKDNSITTLHISPPSATQLYIENHLDDFLPTPSQEVRELLCAIDDDDFLTNTQLARELAVDEPSKDDVLPVMICSQDLIFSSQELLEIMTPCRPPAKADSTKQASQAIRAIPISPEPIQSKQKGRFFEEKEEDLVQAAIHESKNESLKSRSTKSHEPAVTEPADRAKLLDPGKLIGPVSAFSDYGDDEIDEESLLELVADI